MTNIKIENLSFSYQQKHVLKNISVSFEGAGITSIIGPNGAGKSTLLSLVGGLLKPDKGNILLGEKNILALSKIEIAKEISFVTQFSDIVFPFSVMEVVLMARHPYGGIFSLEDDDDIKIAKKSLLMTNAYEFGDRLYNELSGGERQRVLLARALAQTTPAILLDEPTSSLDLKHQKFIFELLFNLSKEQSKNIIIVSHDINLASLYSDKIILLKNGEIIKIGAPGEILDSGLLSDVYETDIEVESPEGKIPYVRINPSKIKNN